jgi:hypothetical protein
MKIENFLTKVKPGTLAIIIIVIALALYLLLNKKKSDTNQQAVDSINVNKNKLSYTETELKFMTTQIFNAMNQQGTDFDTILSVFQSLQDGNDILYIVSDFGVKPYFLTGLADGLVTRFMGTDENLIGWLHEELSSYELAAIKLEFVRLGVNLL